MIGQSVMVSVRFFRFVAAVSITALLLPGGCAMPSSQRPVLSGEPSFTVQVVRHDWHTGLVLRVADLPGGSPLARDFPNATHIEIGWGDREYYMAREPTVWLALRASLWPTPGVLHVAGLPNPPAISFPGSEIVEATLTRTEFERLHSRLNSSFERSEAGGIVNLGPGLYGESRFYASRESFHLFKTCNVWTAEILREAGLPLTPAGSLTAGSLMRQIESLGENIRP